MEELNQEEINEKESEKVIESESKYEGVPQKPQKLAYDPKEKLSEKDIIKGPYAEIEKRTQEKSKLDPETKFAKKMGIKPKGKKMNKKIEKIEKTDFSSVEKQPIDFKVFKDELDSRYDSLGMTRDTYNDEIMHNKIDMILYTLVNKGIFTLEDLVGSQEDDGIMKGGIIETFYNANKTYKEEQR